MPYNSKIQLQNNFFLIDLSRLKRRLYGANQFFIRIFITLHSDIDTIVIFNQILLNKIINYLKRLNDKRMVLSVDDSVKNFQKIFQKYSLRMCNLLDFFFRFL